MTAQSGEIVSDVVVEVNPVLNTTAAIPEGDAAINMKRASSAQMTSNPNDMKRRQSKSVANPGDAKRLSKAVGSGGADLTGLTTAEADRIRETSYPNGNTLPVVEVTDLELFIKQFKGAMPTCIAGCVILSGVAEDWLDVIIIGMLLVLNAVIGFREELHAKNALKALMTDSKSVIGCKRDGSLSMIDTELLVPGDIIALRGGSVVPADSRWVDGGVVDVNTVAMTGETLPRKVPGKDRPAEGVDSGKILWSGCDVLNGECTAVVEKIGIDTEIGDIFMEIQANKGAGAAKSDFEVKILQAVAIIISIAFISGLLMFVIQSYQRSQGYKAGLLATVGVLVGSVPVALPLVLVVTMATGASFMARECNTLVTNLAALQDIASMTVLNSDKTGTLTTAHMAVEDDKIWCNKESGFGKEELFEMCAVACNRDNKEDHIDSGILRKWDNIKNGGVDIEGVVPGTTVPLRDSGPGARYIEDKWKVTKKIGFHNLAKRTACYASRQGSGGDIMITKGLLTKVMRCNHPEVDAPEIEADCDHPRFEVADYARLQPQLVAMNDKFAADGYKTIGVTVQRDTKVERYEFAGLVPMMDPPRADTAMTVQMMRKAGVSVKMITGDQLNIAKTTARIIGLGENMYIASALDEGTPEQIKERILDADGFAETLPSQKLQVVKTERSVGLIVGMTGDGVNDAPALSAAQIGVSVDDAFDVAKNASDIQLMSPGLSAIYSATVESRKIFKRLKAYVTFRLAATVQIIVVLSVITFVSGCLMDTIYIIFIAIANDLTMMPLSSDNQKASSTPEQPNVKNLLIQAVVYGFLEAGITLMWFYLACSSDWGFLKTETLSFKHDVSAWFQYIYDADSQGPMSISYRQCMLHDRDNYGLSTNCVCGGDCMMLCCANYAGMYSPSAPHYGMVSSVCTEITTNALFLQIFISAELLIFPMRTVGWMWTTMANKWLYISIGLTLLVFTILSAVGTPKQIPGLEIIFAQKLGWVNAGWAWLWSLVGLFVVDIVKVYLVLFMEGPSEILTVESVAEAMETSGGEMPTEAAIDQARTESKSMAKRRSTAVVAAGMNTQSNDDTMAVGNVELESTNPGRVARRVSSAIR